eukprot:Blabericola_migrator_1__8590@NODE_449_length_8372_cov_210_980614_g351_i0_p1_GENE_NODE_449_length_8372_cov_210_980614_g351_i0NODE_449_length_8372_cov_210_980614_g351_i0_p1_ORF_typecomplete_len889_score181_91DUF3458_C/PF17432_2/1e02DUF3458_C/PF17432_2/4_2e60Peptidase_M1/PF01433_20/1_8e53DUF3458/PF11940_8/1_9e21Peptidase_M1_N/PF17900_1/3_6e20Peptidase_M1_N/PF17900_1/8_2e03Peptidase_M61/PF05299_12/0_026DUF1533/PF07550_11/0_024DUF1533/PF07550_11/1_6e04_NODE_449_length_8372_cov_210_980614_g351_i056058
MTQEHRIYRKDFRPSAYYVDTVHLTFDLDYETTQVLNKMAIKRRADDAGDLILNGEFCELEKVEIEGKELTKEDYKVGTEREPSALVIPKSLLNENGLTNVTIHNKTFPKANLRLMGLYQSAKLLATQCEPEGFRRITYYIDDPSNMAKFTVVLNADKDKFPVLLSNGDKVNESSEGNRHSATFVDPYPKPAHLFAIVAGELIHVKADFTTMSGRKVGIYVMSEPEYGTEQLEWALDIAVKAFKWDEETFGREYDLNEYRAVGVADFNMGAMENKSLNLFNISAIVARADRTRDVFFKRVAHVVAHEYFHNWSGNRVSVQDWFQIQLKEGFTSFRESLFIEDHFGKGVTRIQQVSDLRKRQFPEDAGPSAHSIRPESYVSIDNFYTATTYLKGLEVIRLYHTLLGKEGFRKGCDLYFSKYDGQAVSCDEFRGAMAEANGRDLSQFELWYSQRRTPRVTVVDRNYNADSKEYTLRLRQTLPDDANYGEPVQAMLIPILAGFIGKQSKKDVREPLVLELNQFEQDFVVPDVTEDSVPSLLRGFSAPVILESFLSDDELGFLMAYDSDEFNMYEAGQILMGNLIISRTKEAMAGHMDLSSPPALPSFVVDTVKELLSGRVQDKGLTALCLIPPASDLASRCPGLNPYVMYQATKSMKKQIAQAFEQSLKDLVQSLKRQEGEPLLHDAEHIGARSLRFIALSYLSQMGEDNTEIQDLVIKEFKGADCYNDRCNIAALLVNIGQVEAAQKLFDEFFTQCESLGDQSVDEWFRMAGSCSREDAPKYIKTLATTHKAFVATKNPNRMRALVVPVMLNPAAFHHPSGETYSLIAEILAEWDTFNSPVASVVAKFMIDYVQYDEETQKRMKEACRIVYKDGQCSTQMKEIVGPACTA